MMTKMLSNLISQTTQGTLQELVGGWIDAQRAKYFAEKIFANPCGENFLLQKFPRIDMVSYFLADILSVTIRFNIIILALVHI